MLEKKFPMCFRFGNAKLGKKLLFLVLLIFGGLALSGCVGSVPARGWSGAMVADGTLYIGSMEGKVLAIDPTDGSQIWEFRPQASSATSSFGCASPPPRVSIYSTPAVEGGGVYFAAYDGRVYALNISGGMRWQYPDDGKIGTIVGDLMVTSGMVYVSSSDGMLYALNAATGKEEWQFKTEGKLWSAPAIDGDVLYIGSFDGKLYALSARDGEKKWEFEAQGALASAPVVFGDTVYVGSFDRHLYAVDTADSSLRWRFEGNNWFWARPLARNGVIYAACLDGKVYAIDARDGDELWQFSTGGAIRSSPALVNDFLVIGSEEGVIYVLRAGDGELDRPSIDMGAPILAPLCTSEGLVYVHVQDDTLHAREVGTGRTLWSVSLRSK